MNPVSKILFGVGAAMVVMIVVAFIWLSLANAHLKVQLAQAQANGTACHLTNDEFAAEVKRQDKAVAQMQAENAAHEKQANEAVSEAQKTAQVFFKAATKLRQANLRGDACKGAETMLDDYIGGGK